MGRNLIEKIVGEGYAARRRNHVEDVLPYFAPNAEFRLAGAKDLAPFTAAAQGHGSLRTLFSGLFANWDWSDYRIDPPIIDSNRARLFTEEGRCGLYPRTP